MSRYKLTDIYEDMFGMKFKWWQKIIINARSAQFAKQLEEVSSMLKEEKYHLKYWNIDDVHWAEEGVISGLELRSEDGYSAYLGWDGRVEYSTPESKSKIYYKNIDWEIERLTQLKDIMDRYGFEKM